MQYDIEVLLPEEEAPTPARTWCYSGRTGKRGTRKGQEQPLHVKESKVKKMKRNNWHRKETAATDNLDGWSEDSKGDQSATKMVAASCGMQELGANSFGFLQSSLGEVDIAEERLLYKTVWFDLSCHSWSELPRKHQKHIRLSSDNWAMDKRLGCRGYHLASPPPLPPRFLLTPSLTALGV